MLYKLQKRAYWTTLVDIHMSWLNWFSFIILGGSPLVIVIVYMNFMSLFLDLIRMFLSKVSFLARLDWNSLPVECFPLTYDVNGFMFNVNSHLLSLGSF